MWRETLAHEQWRIERSLYQPQWHQVIMVDVNGEMYLNGDLRSILVNTATAWRKEVGNTNGSITEPGNIVTITEHGEVAILY